MLCGGTDGLMADLANDQIFAIYLNYMLFFFLLFFFVGSNIMYFIEYFRWLNESDENNM